MEEFGTSQFFFEKIFVRSILFVTLWKYDALMKLFEDKTQARPFIKWAGGKTQLLDEVKKSLPRDFATRQHVTYVEPFVGGGAVIFWILQAYPNIERAVINDINEELICTYRVIKTDVEALISKLTAIQDEYIPLNAGARKDFFMGKRALFNTKKTSPLETAALFIFLNRTCFNGLYRVNSKGQFNVPHGRYANPAICDEQTLRADSALLQKVEIICGDFEQTGRYAAPNVIYYLDPPYRPLTPTASFTSYSKDGFDEAEQTRLRDFCRRIARKKSLFVASNSDPANISADDRFFDNLYEMFCIKRVSAVRMINSKGSGRGAVSEILISNVDNTY